MDPVEKEELMRNSEKRSRSRSRGRRSRSKSRSRRYSRSRSISPPYRGGGRFRGINNRFNRRSPFRRNFRDRFRRSRSTSRGRYDRKDRRRYDPRRSKSRSPSSSIYNQQQQQMNYSNDAYNSYMSNAPQAPQFSGQLAQFNSYDFQASYPPPAPAFNMNQGMLGNIACPIPPGMGENWVPPLNMQPQLNESEEERSKRLAAIAEEKKRQREGLIKQRNQCKIKSEKMEKELKQLKKQKSDLLASLGKRSPSPKSNNIIKEFDKLKSEISTRLDETLKIVEMLDGIIKKDSNDEIENQSTNQRKSESDDTSPERIKNEILKSLDRKRAKEMEEKKPQVEKFNYILYDPELHWCKHCQVFPASAKDYLTHLHTKEHLEKIANRATDAPWRASFQKQNEVPSYPDAPTKRAPIKGLQFFEPATAWFCKLCDVFMGDSFCVSLHLKSEIHAERYNKLLEREPKFEEKWLEARNKALELTGKSTGDNQSKKGDEKQSIDKKSKKKKNKKDVKKKRKHGKKRKRGSSSSSSSNSEDDSSSSESESSSKKNDSDQVESRNSIRVAMRNLLNKASTNENDERTGKWTMVSIDSTKPKVPPAPTISQHAVKEIKNDEKFIGQWNTVESVISPEEKRLVESLKGKFKSQQKQENASEKSTIVNKRDEDKSRSRSRDRNRSDRVYRNRYSRSRSKSRGRRSRTRSNSRDRRFRRYSRSRSRSRSRGRNSRPRYGRPPISFPSEPRPPVKEEKLPTRSYISTVKKDESSSSSSALTKRMPFIGKMPVFKKQLVEKKNEDQAEEKKSSDDENQTKKTKTDEMTNDEKWDELMPDPLQFSAMMNVNMQQHQQQIINEEVPDAPPGLDPELDSDLIPKPISDAPILREGPLPKDFQATLDLLFDGDKPKPVVIEPSVPEIKPEPLPVVVNTDGPQMILPEELSQHALLYGNYYQPTASTEIAPVPPPPPINATNNNATNEEDKVDDKNSSAEIEQETDDKMNKNQEDMDDLAMLGIDVNDVGSGFW